MRNRRFVRMAVTMRMRYQLYNHHRDCILRATGAAGGGLDGCLTAFREV